MQNQKIKYTNHKFYGKWLYKVTLTIKGCGMLRIHPIAAIKDFCLGPKPEENSYRYKQEYWHNRDDILTLCEFLEGYDKSIFAKRIERHTIDLYTNDLDFYNTAVIKFAAQLKHSFEPPAESIDIITGNKNCIAVKKLPKNRYNYRVYLLPHKLSNDYEAKTKYINWLKTQQPRVTCTPAVEKWFIATDWNWDRRYVLVEDEHTLMMLKLRNAEVVGKIYNFVVADKY